MYVNGEPIFMEGGGRGVWELVFSLSTFFTSVLNIFTFDQGYINIKNDYEPFFQSS